MSSPTNGDSKRTSPKESVAADTNFTEYCKTIGSIANVVCFVGNAAYLWIVWKDANPNQPNDSIWLDPTWVKSGFCISLANEPFQTSHDVCFVLDILACIFCLWTYRQLSEDITTMATTCSCKANSSQSVLLKDSKDLNNLMLFHSCAIGLHGFGHGFLAFILRLGLEKTHWTVADATTGQVLFGFLLLIAFFGTLLKGTLSNMDRFQHFHIILSLMVIFSSVFTLYMGTAYAFPVIQGLVMTSFAFNSLATPLRQKQSLYYLLVPVVVGIPATFIPWVECMACEEFQISYGGHVMYDAWLPLGLIAVYLIMYVHVVKQFQSYNRSKIS